MNYQDYKQILMDELWEQKPQEISEYQIKTIIKQNERLSDCVTPVYTDGGNLAPILYLEQFYDPDYDTEQIKTLASQLTNHFLEAHRVQSHFDISQINPHTAQTHLTLRLYNRALNPEIEQTCAHIDCLDLMAVPRWTVGNTQEISSSFLVNRELQRTLLHMTDDEILQIARANTMAQDYSIMGMNRLLREKLKEVSDEVVSEVMPTDAASEHYHYQFANPQFEVVSAGQLDNGSLSMTEAAAKVMDFYGTTEKAWTPYEPAEFTTKVQERLEAIIVEKENTLSEAIQRPQRTVSHKI